MSRKMNAVRCPLLSVKQTGFRLQIRQNGLDGCAELTGLRGGIPGLNGDVDL